MKINLKERNTIKVELADENGKLINETLEFDMEDIELPLKYQQMVDEYKKAQNWAKDQMIIINKKEDVKSDIGLSRNQVAKMKAINEFVKKQMDILDIFLGENGCKKMLNGRKPYVEMFEDIMETLEPVIKEINKDIRSIEDRIKAKYSIESNDNVLE